MVAGLYDPLFACFEALGGRGDIEGTKVVAPGIAVPDYVISFDAAVSEAGGEKLDEQVRACQEKHAEFVWRALFLQPMAVDARANEMMLSLPSIRDCLDRFNITLAEDATVAEVQAALAEGHERGTDCFVPGEYGSAN